MSSISFTNYEGFFSLPDVDVCSSDLRKIVLSTDKAVAQIFKAQATTLPYIFFMASFASDDLISQLKISVYAANGDYSLGSLLGTMSCSTAMRISKVNAAELTRDSSWYRWDCSAVLGTLSVGNNYAIVFSVDGTSTPNLFFTSSYRESIFPTVLATSNYATQDWLNANFTEGYGIEIKTGAICSGFLGNEVDGTTTLNSGDIVLGGANTSRGYPVFVYVKNSGSNIRLKFGMSNSVDSTTYYNDETENTYMSWYSFQAGTLPISNNSALFNNTVSAVTIKSPDDFVLFSQPDKFPAYPKMFFPEVQVELTADKMEVGYFQIDSYSNLSKPIQAVPGVIFNNTDKLSASNSNWAVFSEKKNVVIGTDNNPDAGEEAAQEAINPALSTNPPSVVFSLEKQNDVEQIIKIELNNTQANIVGTPTGYLLPTVEDNLGIRGFTNVTFFKDSYVSFGKYLSYISGQTINGGPKYLPHSNNDRTGITTTPGYFNFPIIVSDLKFSLNNLQYARICGGIPSVSFVDADSPNIDQPVKFVGVYDTCSATLPSGKQILYILFQCIPSTNTGSDWDGKGDKAYFCLGYLHEDDFDAPSINCFTLPGIAEEDAKFISEQWSLDNDVKGAKFIPSPEPNIIYFTCRNYKFGTNFGLWKIDLTVEAPIIAPDALIGSRLVDVTLYCNDAVSEHEYSRGFGESQESEITCVLQTKENEVYYGVCVYAAGVHYRLGQVHRLTYINGNLTHKVILNSNDNIETEPWTIGYSDVSSEIDSDIDTPDSKHYSLRHENNNVVFMAMVDNVLHAWLTSYIDGYDSWTFQRNNMTHSFPTDGYGYGYAEYSGVFNYHYLAYYVGGTYGGTPFHVACDLVHNRTMVLRRFPMNSTGGDDVVGDFGEIWERNSFSDNYPYYLSSDIRHISGGTICGNKIHIVGMGPNGFNVGDPGDLIYNGAGTADFHEKDIWTPKWISYDIRTINSAVLYYGDIDSNSYPFRFQTIASSAWIDYSEIASAFTIDGTLGNGENSTGLSGYSGITNGTVGTVRGLYWPFKFLSNAPDGTTQNYGTYKPTSVVKLDSPGNDFYESYPESIVTENTPRVALYCQSVFGIENENSTIIRSDYLFTGSYKNAAGIEFDRDPIVVAQGGLPFVICNNFTHGFHAYKTYGGGEMGMKNWGINNSVTDRVTGMEFLYDWHVNCFKHIDENYTIAPTVSVSQSNDITYISGLKIDYLGGIPEMDTDPYRYIFRITAGTQRPQTLSFYYKYNYLRDKVDAARHRESDVLITDYIKDKLKIPGTVTFRLKYADSYDDIFINPKGEMEIPLAFDLTGDDEFYFYHHTFNTDIGYLFYSLECLDLPTPYDADYTWNVPESGLTIAQSDPANSTNKVPYAEILIKGLKLGDVNLDTVDSSNCKKISINGILTNLDSSPKSNDSKQSPSDIVNGEIVFQADNEIVVDFPSQIYVSEISFDITDRRVLEQEENVVFKISYLPKMAKNTYGEDIVTKSDWVEISDIDLSAQASGGVTLEGDKVHVKVDNLSLFCQSISIVSFANIPVPVANFGTKTFGSNPPTGDSDYVPF